ncbi:MAG: hypothetical protein WCD35_09705 [Mycobacteriales bacterium]
MTHSSRSANQSKTEPFPAAPAQGEAETPGAGHPQQAGASVQVGSGGPGDAADVATPATEAAPGTSEQSPVVQGIFAPDVDEADPRNPVPRKRPSTA